MGRNHAQSIKSLMDVLLIILHISSSLKMYKM
jgi:hypothetical protein